MVQVISSHVNQAGMEDQSWSSKKLDLSVTRRLEGRTKWKWNFEVPSQQALRACDHWQVAIGTCKRAKAAPQPFKACLKTPVGDPLCAYLDKHIIKSLESPKLERAFNISSYRILKISLNF